jgi:hypothetical protein
MITLHRLYSAHLFSIDHYFIYYLEQFSHIANVQTLFTHFKTTDVHIGPYPCCSQLEDRPTLRNSLKPVHVSWTSQPGKGGSLKTYSLVSGQLAPDPGSWDCQ